MLSEKQQVKACYRRHEWPLLPEPVNVRVKFQKIGDLQYISHLDLQRTLHRILVRAGIPMWYTKGFNPHAKIVFSTPLSVGAESICEMVDIRIDRDMPCEEIKRLLNCEVTEELQILDVYIPNTKFPDIVWASYDIKLYQEGIAQYAEDIQKLIEEESVMAAKKTKSGLKDVNILPLIRDFSLNKGENSDYISINATLNVAQDTYLNPEILIRVFRERFGILLTDDSAYTILRTATYFADGITPFR